jgi:PAS domain S-box-containing protein
MTSVMTLDAQAALIESAFAATIVRDVRNIIVFWNRQAEQVYGYSKSEALGSVVTDLLRSVFPQGAQAIERELSANGVWEGEIWHTRRDGRQIRVLSCQSLQRSPTGEIVGTLEVNLDVTAQREAEEAARALNAQLERTVVEQGHSLRLTQAEISALEESRYLLASKQMETRQALSAREIELHAANLRLQQQNEALLLGTEILEAERTRLGRALEDLAQSEASYRVMGETLPFGVWACDPGGATTYLSQSFLDLIGMPAHEAYRSGWTERLHPDERARLIREWQTCVQTGADWDTEQHLLGSDGSYHTVLSRGRPVRDADGRITKYVGINLEIDDLVRANQERDRLLADNQRQNNLLETLIHSLPVGVALLEGPELRFLLANASYSRMKSVHHEPMIGRTFTEVFPTARVSLELLHQVLETGEPVSGKEFAADFNEGRGVTFWDFHLIPIVHGSGEVHQVLVLTNDVTDKVLARQQAEAASARTQAILESMSEGVIVVNGTTGDTSLNSKAQDLLGCPASMDGADLLDSLSRRFMMTDIGGLPLETSRLPISRACRGETFQNQLVRMKEREGKREWIGNWSGSAVRDSDGQLLSGIASFRDVSEYIKTAQERERLLAEQRAGNERLHSQTLELSAQAAEIQQRNNDLSRVAQALSRERALRDAILQQMLGGVAIANADGELTMVNMRLTQILTRHHQQPALYAGLQQRLRQVLRSGESIPEEEVTLSEDCTVTVGASSVQDEEGNTVAAVAVVHDITEHKALENALRESRDVLEERVTQRTAELAETNTALARSEALLRQTLESLPVGVWIADASGTLVWTNPMGNRIWSGARMVPREQFGEYVAWYGDTGARLSAEDWAVYKAVTQGHSTLSEELTILCFDGTQRVILNSAVALRDDSGQIFGAVAVNEDITPRKQAEKQLARYSEELQQSHNQLQALARRLVEVQENERRVLARELHDEVGQELTSLIVGLKLLENDAPLTEPTQARLDELKETTRTVMETIHSLAVTLRPASLDRLGLVPAVRQYVESTKQRSGLKVTFGTLAMDDVRLPPEVETTVYRVIQEAITNVLRHAQATQIGVVLERRGSSLIGIVEDDGCGFDATAAMLSGRLGLFGMQERAEMLGGSLTIESSVGIGTTVFVEVPCNC